MSHCDNESLVKSSQLAAAANSFIEAKYDVPMNLMFRAVQDSLAKKFNVTLDDSISSSDKSNLADVFENKMNEFRNEYHPLINEIEEIHQNFERATTRNDETIIDDDDDDNEVYYPNQLLFARSAATTIGQSGSESDEEEDGEENSISSLPVPGMSNEHTLV